MGKSGNPAKRAAQAYAEPVEYDPTPVDENGTEDFDAFWSKAGKPGIPVKILGRVFHLVPSLPLRFEMDVQRMDKSKSDKHIRRLVGLLFQEDNALDLLVRAGVTADQFAVLLAWAPQRIGGGNMSLAEVAAKVAEAEAAADPS